VKKSPAAIIGVLAAYGQAVVSQLYLPVPLLGEVAETYGVSVAAAGLVLTVFGIAYAVGSDLLTKCGLSRTLGEEDRLPLPGPPKQLQAASALALKRSKFALP